MKTSNSKPCNSYYERNYKKFIAKLEKILSKSLPKQTIANSKKIKWVHPKPPDKIIQCIRSKGYKIIGDISQYKLHQIRYFLKTQSDLPEKILINPDLNPRFYPKGADINHTTKEIFEKKETPESSDLSSNTPSSPKDSILNQQSIFGLSTCLQHFI